MRKLFMLIAVPALAAVFAYSLPSSAAAVDNPPPPRQTDQSLAPEKFPELKARILQRIEERLKRTQEEKACVEAAQSNEDLQKCRPERPNLPRQGGGPGGQMPGPKGQMPPQQPGGPRE